MRLREQAIDQRIDAAEPAEHGMRDGPVGCETRIGADGRQHRLAAGQRNEKGCETIDPLSQPFIDVLHGRGAIEEHRRFADDLLVHRPERGPGFAVVHLGPPVRGQRRDDLRGEVERSRYSACEVGFVPERGVGRV